MLGDGRSVMPGGMSILLPGERQIGTSYIYLYMVNGALSNAIIDKFL